MAVIEGRTWLEILQPAQCWRSSPARSWAASRSSSTACRRSTPSTTSWMRRRSCSGPTGQQAAEAWCEVPIVCFEVDGTDPVARRGWSVMVKGRAVEVAGGDNIARLTGLDLRYWAPGEKQHWIRIEPEQVTGRRINRPEADR